jgi:hypothetical protein
VRAPVSLLIATLLAGCAEPPRLLPAGPAPETESRAAPALPEARPSAWDSVGDLQLPPDRWIVAWTPMCAGCAVRPRADVIDVLGRSLVPLPLPTWPPVDGLGAEHYEVVDLLAGPQATALLVLGAASAEAYDQEHTRIVLRLDPAYPAGPRVQPILAAGFPDELLLPLAEVELRLDHDLHRLLVAPDATDPDRIWLAAAQATGAELVGTLISVDVADRTEPVRQWSLAELVPDGSVAGVFALTSYSGGIAIGMQIRRDDRLSHRVYMGRLDNLPLLEAIDLDSVAPLVRAQITVGPEPAALTRAAVGGCWEGSVAVSVPGGVRRVSPGGDCVQPLTLLDAAAPTLLHTDGDSLIVSHRGEDVWSVDRFGVGLDDLPFQLHEAAALRLPQ